MGSRAVDNVVAKIKRILAQREMGEGDLAKASGLKPDDILQYLTRQKKLDLETLDDIAEALRIPMEHFFKEAERWDFGRAVKDPRLTKEENAFLVERLFEIRDAYTELLLKKRESSHDRDHVAG